MNALVSRRFRFVALAAASALVLSGCNFTPYSLPLPGGADLGDNPYTVKAEFRDAMDLVPQGGVRSSDVTVGKITDIQLKPGSWTALVTMQINGDAKLPDNVQATIRQTSLLGEKFVSLDAPEGGGFGQLNDGDVIGLDRSGRNPELEEVLSATALLFNGGGLDKINVITRELNKVMDGRESNIRDLIENATAFNQTLDSNKFAVLTALERIDRLAVSTNRQEASIDEALRDVPPALRVLDDQRDDLVKMLDSLEDLSNVATRVIKKSKKDTLTDLKLLEPVLKGLADAGDSLVGALRGLITFPFSDGFVGDSLAVASAPCPVDTVQVAQAGACFGDYINLDINLQLNERQAQLLIIGLLSFFGFNIPGVGTGSASTAADSPTESKAPSAASQRQAAEVLDAVKKAGLDDTAQAAESPADSVTESPLPTATPTDEKSAAGEDDEQDDSNPLCGVSTKLCRAPAVSFAIAQQSDLGRLLVDPVVVK